MTRLIDPSLDKLSRLMSQMGDMAMECVSLAVDSYLEGKGTGGRVRELSNEIKKKYFEVEDLTFDMLLKYQPVADDFRLIRSSTEISYAFSRFGRYAYDITQVRHLFGDISECKNASLFEAAKKVKHMIREAVLSFAELDVRKAIKIQEDEAFIDRMYKERLPKLIELEKSIGTLTKALESQEAIEITERLENMINAVNYIVTGKHRPTESQILSHTPRENLDLDQ